MRLVSLCPSITETLIALGQAQRLVGITRFCIHPAEIVKQLPKIGGTKDPDLQKIREAQPDLIFFNEEENRKEDHEALCDLRIDVSYPRRVDEVPADLRRFGALVGAEAPAEQFARTLEQELAALKRPAEPTFRFAYMIWRKPWMTVSQDTYVSDLLERAGGQNIFADESQRYPTTSLEALGQGKPDLVLLSDEPFPFAAPHVEEVQAALGPKPQVELVSGDDCCWHGVRSIRGVRLASKLRDRFA